MEELDSNVWAWGETRIEEERKVDTDCGRVVTRANHKLVEIISSTVDHREALEIIFKEACNSGTILMKLGRPDLFFFSLLEKRRIELFWYIQSLPLGRR